MNSYTNLLQIMDELETNGKTITYTKLPTRKPRKADLTSSRVGGSKTAWRPSIRLGHASRHLKDGQPNQ